MDTEKIDLILDLLKELKHEMLKGQFVVRDMFEFKMIESKLEDLRLSLSCPHDDTDVVKGSTARGDCVETICNKCKGVLDIEIIR